MKLEKINRRAYKYFLYGLIIGVVLLIAITFIPSKAKYRYTDTVPLVKGKINYKMPDLDIIAIYINDGDGNYKELAKDETVPTSGYSINDEKSYCYKVTTSEHDNNVKFYTNELGEHIIKNLSKNDKCHLYFDKNTNNAKTISELLSSHYVIKTDRTSETKDFNVPFDKTTYGVMYSAIDDYGTSYYFAGNPLDNWIKFGGYYWRIIRINGDGSIRMIYQGKGEADPQTIGEETQIGTSAFNSEYKDNKYVGYFYEQDNVHGLKEQSTIYGVLNNWYNANIKGKSFEKEIDTNAGFCNDRQPYLDGDGTAPIAQSGTGLVETYYASYVRLRPGGFDVTKETTAVTPSFKCADKTNDLFTYTGATQGNKKIGNPIGLITADEVSYAGMIANYKDIDSRTITNYLYTGKTYWTMSPNHLDGNNAYMFATWSTGFLGSWQVASMYGVRPVINLRSDVKLIGNGTMFNPYEVLS